MKPIGSSVVVKKLENDDTTSGGIILPPTADYGGNVVAEVVAIGSGILLKDGTKVPLEVEVGDKVLLRKMQGKAVGEPAMVGDEEFTIVDESGLLAIWIDD